WEDSLGRCWEDSLRNSLGRWLMLPVSLKGDRMMTFVPFTHCCRLLAIDAKTLRQWIKQAHLCVHAHPEDARIKCLTTQQVQQLATLHHRCIQEDVATIASQICVVQDPAKPMGEQLESLPIPVSHSLPCACLSCCDLLTSHLALQ